MPEIDPTRFDKRDGDAKLDDSSSSPGFVCCDLEVKLEEKEEEEEDDSICLNKKKKISRRGRPPKTAIAKASSSSTYSPSPISATTSQCRKKREDEDVCFLCFDGGSLILCDRRGCPKVYHPTCVKRSEAFFRSRSKWNCGWHICTVCQKDSYYMCYTCPYSVCKRCVRSSEYVVVKESKGLCGICMKTIKLIENIVDDTNNQERVNVDFDDRGSWEYLFKIYWVSLKEKLSLSLDDLTNAKNPWKGSFSMTSSKKRATTSRRLHDKDVTKERRGKVRRIEDVSSSKLGSSLCQRLPPLTSVATWASDELLDFVGYMKNGDISSLSKYDVQTLLLEHVRRNNLQNSPHNSEIICDPKLMRLFGKERVDHFEMLKLLDSHFLRQERSLITDTAAMSSQANASRSQAVVNTETCADASTVWLYGDPDGKIHGPFSLLNLQQWNSGGHFPPELRIWRFDEEQNRSILLTDALNGQFDKTSPLQDHYIPTKQEETVISTIANDQDTSVVVVATKLESRVLDFSPNSVSTDQSVISSSNSVITRCSDTSNKSGNSFNPPLDFEREGLCSVSLWNKIKVDSPSLVQSPISCSLSLATLPGNTNSNRSLPQQERWNVGNAAKNDTCSLNGAIEKQAMKATTFQSCGQNWNAATPSSASNAWDCNNGLVSFADNQEIDFLDLCSPTFKFNFGSSTTTTTTTTEWQPIVAGPDECDESVSDLLAEVEAMESRKLGIPSPTSTYRSFSPMSSTTNDLQQMHSRTNNNTFDF